MTTPPSRLKNKKLYYPNPHHHHHSSRPPSHLPLSRYGTTRTNTRTTRLWRVLRVRRHTSGTTPSSSTPPIAPTNHRLRDRLVITSAAFASKPQLARHRVVNSLLKEELEREGGIHALQLRTLTPEEEERLMKRAKELESQGEESK